MNRLMITLGVALAVASSSFGNVGVFKGSGQTPIVDKTDAVQMVEEEVVMTPRKAKGPVTVRCNNLDPMDYHCTFKLRNLKNEPVEIQVGFPLDTDSHGLSDKSADDVKELVSSFSFSARCGNEQFDVRFTPADKGKRFSKLFLWIMRFAPLEERTLVVSYSLDGYLGLGYVFAELDSQDVESMKSVLSIDDGLLTMFSQGNSECHSYVTGTGACWAGTIEKAVFKYYPQEFEAYLARRGSYDESEADRKERLAELKKEDKKGVRSLLKPDSRMVRRWQPAPDKWTRVDDGDGLFHYELSFSPFKPASEDAIRLGYVAPPMPTDTDDVAMIEWIVHKFVESSGGDEEQYSRDAKDVVLEFYGVKTGNSRIAPFLKAQCWWGQNPAAMPDKAVVKRLME